MTWAVKDTWEVIQVVTSDLVADLVVILVVVTPIVVLTDLAETSVITRAVKQ
jgi:hypothetical protein